MLHALPVFCEGEPVSTRPAVAAVAVTTVVCALGAVLHALPVFREAEPFGALFAVPTVTDVTIVRAPWAAPHTVSFFEVEPIFTLFAHISFAPLAVRIAAIRSFQAAPVCGYGDR